MVIQPTCRMRMVKRLSTGSVEFNTLHCKGPEAVAIRLSSLWIPLKTTCIAFELILSCHQLLLQRWLRFRVRYIKIISDDDQCKMYQTRHWIVILQHVCGMLGLFKMLKMDERGQIILPVPFFNWITMFLLILWNCFATACLQLVTIQLTSNTAAQSANTNPTPCKGAGSPEDRGTLTWRITPLNKWLDKGGYQQCIT